MREQNKRKWSCEKYKGVRGLPEYEITLTYGDYKIRHIITQNDLNDCLQPNKFVEYILIRLNENLKRTVFPMTKDLGESNKLFNVER